MTSTTTPPTVPSPAELVDLRSDTVTRPSVGMRAAMAAAQVGDDQYGEDAPTNLLQARMAERLGKAAALWLPSGTMANQVALRILTRPGDEVVVSRECHAAWHETGGSAANSGVQLHEIGQGGVFSAAEAEAAIKPAGLPVFPPSTLLEIENTHNRAGGIVFPQAEVVRICALARARGLATFLDGARLWNASVASGLSEAELAAPFDLVAVSFSKGLGAPGGSLLAGSAALIEAAQRQRRMLGGAMRQTGFFAAAALYAVEHQHERLAEDHLNARRLAEALGRCRGVQLDLETVQTNIVVFGLDTTTMDGASLVAAARERGVLLNAMAPRTLRAVTHLDVSRAQIERAARMLATILG